MTGTTDTASDSVPPKTRSPRLFAHGFASLCLLVVVCEDPVPSGSSAATGLAKAPDGEPAPETETVAEEEAQSPPTSKAMLLLSEVTVERVEIDFGEPEERWSRALWDAFANQPYHEKFTVVTNERWHESWQLYEARILEVARDRGFDAESLGRCLEAVEPLPDADIALLPIGAFLARRGAEPVWIILCNWEWSPTSANWGDSTPPEHRVAAMSHIRAWALTARECRQVDYMTCS